MKEPETIPDGFELRAADPVQAMCIGDLCTGNSGTRYRLVGSQYPCELHLLFQAIGPTHELIELPLSQASALMKPDENRVEGLHTIAPVAPK